MLSSYGWDNDSVYSALARNIPNVELKDYAIDVVYEINLNEFIDEQLDEINWLNMIDGEDEGRFDDIICDLKPSFEDSYFNKSDDSYPYDEWYDDFTEEKIIPYLEEKLKKSGY